MTESTISHPGCGKYLCCLNNLGLQISTEEEYKQFVRNREFMCKNCGRAAASQDNLCKPVKL